MTTHSKIPQQAAYIEKAYANSGMPELIEMIDISGSLFVDIGCGSGANAALLKRKKPNTEIHGITINEWEAVRARSNGCDNVLVLDAQGWEPECLFDGIIMCHFLEHLAWPCFFLKKCRRLLNHAGYIYVALPNVMMWRQRLKFLRGEFKYENSGMMDNTHLRFFDWSSAVDMVCKSGFEIVSLRGRGVFPLWKSRKYLPDLLVRKIDKLAITWLPNLFATDILIKARPSRPRVESRVHALP